MINWMLVATIGSMVAFWVTALFILYQIRHMQASRNAEVTMRMFEWAESNRMRHALRWVRTQFDLPHYLSQPESERSDYPWLVIAFFEQAGVMIERKMVNPDVVLDNVSLSVIQSWQKLEPLIRHERQETQDDRFGEHFELIYSRSVTYESGHRRQPLA